LNQWREVWLAYHHKSSKWTLFFSIIKQGTLCDKLLLLFSFFVFITGFYLHFSHTPIALLLIAVSELVLLYKFGELKKSLLIDEYSFYDDSQVPHNDEDHKTSRYLMFKTQLLDKKITKYQVEQCFDLLST